MPPKNTDTVPVGTYPYNHLKTILCDAIMTAMGRFVNVSRLQENVGVQL